MSDVVSPANGSGDAFSTDGLPANMLHLSPAVLWRLVKLADRHGLLTVSKEEDETVVLLDTKGSLVPDVMLRLDTAGDVVGRVLLGVPPAAQEEEDDDFEEIPQLTAAVAALGDGATLGRRCRCERPLANGEGCSRCGCPLPGAV